MDGVYVGLLPVLLTAPAGDEAKDDGLVRRPLTSALLDRVGCS